MKIGAFLKRRPPHKAEHELVGGSGLFDAAWYLRSNPDVKAAVIPPLDHYLANGASELRNPGPLFDAKEYAERYADQPAARANPLLHYLRNGGSREECVERLRAEIRKSGLFDANWYLSTYPDVAAAGADALDHFICNGAAELRDPSPSFNTSWYLKQVQDPRATANPLLYFLRHGASMHIRVAEIHNSNAIAAQLLSDIEHLDPELPNLKQTLANGPLTVVDGVRRDETADAWNRLFASLNQPFQRMLFLPRLARGDANQIAFYAARATIDLHGINSLLIVVTDGSSTEALDGLPAGAHVRILDEYGSDLSAQDRMELSLWLIQALRPRNLLNINSMACWEVLRSHGAALSTFCELHAALLGREFDDSGLDIGYSNAYFRPSIQYLKSVLFDNQNFADELAEQFGMPPSMRSRLKRVYQPAPFAPRRGALLENTIKPMSVLWSGRFCRQRNLDLLIEIAKRGPSFCFEVFGGGGSVYGDKLAVASRASANLTTYDGYPSFSDLPADRFGAFLYTTLWDGLPNVLIAAAAAGLPIIAPAVGGIPELVDESTGWLIRDARNPQAYLDALKDINDSPQEATQRTDKMRRRLLQRHSWTAYLESLNVPPSFLS
jgi:glycosyltransferase involved in cell wall biosynthesis